MLDSTKQLLADSMSAVAMHLCTDQNSLATCPMAAARALEARKAVQGATDKSDRERLLAACRDHQDQVYKKAAFVLLHDEFPDKVLEDVASSSNSLTR